MEQLSEKAFVERSYKMKLVEAVDTPMPGFRAETIRQVHHGSPHAGMGSSTELTSRAWSP